MNGIQPFGPILRGAVLRLGLPDKLTNQLVFFFCLKLLSQNLVIRKAVRARR